MSFQFSLQTLLRYRLGLEDRAWLKLQAATAEVYSARARVHQAEAAILCCHAERTMANATSVSAAELQFASDCEGKLGVLRQELLAALAEKEQVCEQQRGTYLLARRERESLENIREAQRKLWVAEESRREQNAADELFLLRRAFSQPNTVCLPK